MVLCVTIEGNLLPGWSGCGGDIFQIMMVVVRKAAIIRSSKMLMFENSPWTNGSSTVSLIG